MTIFLSILIPVYNVERYLDECLISILNQLPNNCEIILCDDGSTDGSALICDRYAFLYPNTIKSIHKRNEGLLLTRRRLFLESRGKWVFCVDSDDYIKRNMLPVIIKYLENDYRHVDILYFNAECSYLNGTTKLIAPKINTTEIYEGSTLQKVYEAKVSTYSLNHMWAKIIRRSIIDLDADYSSFELLSLGEDSLQTYRLLDRAKRVAYIDLTLYCYRKNESGITYRSNLKIYPMRKLLWPVEDVYLDKWKLETSIVIIAMNQRVTEIMAFLSDFAIKYSYQDYKKMIEIVADDGFLENAISRISGNEKVKRYKRYTKNILNRKFFLSWAELNVEALIRRWRDK